MLCLHSGKKQRKKNDEIKGNHIKYYDHRMNIDADADDENGDINNTFAAHTSI